MARITVEDCLKRIPNRFQLTLATTYRARQLAHRDHARQADGHRVARNRSGQGRRGIPEPRPHGLNADRLGVCFTTSPAVAGTPPHPRRGEKRRTSSFPLPSFLKEGWREAPGWLAVCFTTPPAIAGTPPHPRRGEKRPTRSAGV